MAELALYTHRPTSVQCARWMGREDIEAPGLRVVTVNEPHWVPGARRKLLRISGHGEVSFAQIGDWVCKYPDGHYMSLPDEAFHELYQPSVPPEAHATLYERDASEE